MSDAVQGREVARRVFAAEFDDATLSYSEGDEERAPNYVVTPTGARANRLFAVGALTAVEDVNEDALRGRIADPTGVFVTYAGPYQPDAASFLERASPPCFVSLTGKARTYQPEDSDRVFSSVRPESINEVDADTRDRWVVAAAEATLERVATTAAALELDVRGEDLRAVLESGGVDAALAAGVALAIDHYGPTEHYLEAVRRMAVQALELVAGERDTVEAPGVAPDEPGPDELGALPVVAAASAAPGDAVASVSPDASTADDAGEVTADDADEVTADDADEVTADDAGEVTADDAGEVTADDAGEVTADDAGEVTADDAVADSSATEPDDSDASAVGASESSAGAEVASDDSAPVGGSADIEDSAAAGDSDDSAAGASDGLGDFGSDDAAVDDVSDTAGDAAADDTDSEPSASEAPAEGDVNGGGQTAADVDEDEMYELDEEERAEIEAEYGTEFTTGNEVGEPGEADIDVPDVDDLESAADPEPTGDGSTDGTGADPAASASGSGARTDSESGADPEPDAAGDESADDGSAGTDLEDAAVSVMADLDDGDGADREAVVAAVVDEHGVDPDDVEDAIQDALMDGQCYEPAEGTLKAI